MALHAGYYRHPALHGDSISFVCEDDLWIVQAEGGTARRLTASPGTISFPSFSPDGSKIALIGRDEGPTEVYVMDAEGGAPRRLTWLGGQSQVIGWHPDGQQILFASDWRQPFRNFVHLYSVPAAGGVPERLGLGPARAITYQPGGPGLVLGRNSGDTARWKRYRGGTAGTLWIDRTGKGNFVPLVKLRGNLASPLWLGDRIYFLSDHEGIGNLYSCTPTGRNLRRHTHHEDYYVRFPSTDGRRIVYHAGADLFLFDPEASHARKVEVRIPSPRSQRNRKFVPAARYLEGFELHPEGHSLAAVLRGGLFNLGLWEGAARRHGTPSSVRYRLGRWLPGGKKIVAVTDQGGEEGLILFSADGTEKHRVIPGDFGRAVDLAVAPAGPLRCALTNHRQEVLLIDLAQGRAKTIERSPYGRIEGLAWSPDGRWLAYGFAPSRRTCQLRLLDTESGKVTPITRPDFRDVLPSFDPEGNYLYFISWRIFDPVYDSHYFDLGFPRGSRPFLITLRPDVASPFSPATRPLRPPGLSGVEWSGLEGRGPEGKVVPRKKVPRIEIALKGIEDRVVAFPVPEGRYGRILGTEGRAFFSCFPVEGSLESTWANAGEPSAKGRLEMHTFAESKTETVIEKITDFSLSANARVLGLRVGNNIRVVPVGWKNDRKPGAEEPGRESGWIDLTRPRVAVIPEEEWKQMFREAWRLQRDQFWTPDMSGIDWQTVHDRYFPLVNRVSSRAEFSDLMWEMQGELGTSHCYELGGDYRPEPDWHQGFLGADLVLDTRSGTWRIVRIPHGDSWEERKGSPLKAPGVNLKPGDEILEIGGEPVNRHVSPYERLVNLPEQEIQLLVRSSSLEPVSPGRKKRASSKGTKPASKVRTVTVRTLREEYGLRYRDWVEANRERVHRDSKERIGYVHIPNMGPVGYAEFHRYFASEVDREGLVIDVRWNGGGHVSQLLLEKLLRRRVGYDATRWGVPEPYPSDAPMGPMVALTNEYAGSDGDIFSHCFKLYKLGPLIGKRTWGGVVGIWPRHSLVDATVTTQPEFAFWFEDVGWGVENYGTDPDIEVEIRPQDHAAGKDPQLERSLTEVLRILKKRPPLVPSFRERPRLGPVSLPRLPAPVPMPPARRREPDRKAARARRRGPPSRSR